MEHTQTEKQYFQLDDVASALGLSSTTVSRAISGKGRVSEETRRRVMDFIERCEYRPNSIARSLAQSRTDNIAVVLPTDSFSSEVPFFQNAMIGVSLFAQQYNYDVIVVSVSEGDLSSLKRVIVNRKVDGVVLTRSISDDPCVSYLKQVGIPFVLIGRSQDESIAQIDSDNAGACRALTKKLLLGGMKRPAYLYGSSEHIVNQSRLAGFLQGASDAGLSQSDCRITKNLSSRSEIASEVDQLLLGDTDCIICGDDYICSRVLSQLSEQGISIPEQMRVVSFFDSVLLENFRPPVPAVHIDACALGRLAANRLLSELTEQELMPVSNSLQNTYTIKESYL